MIVTKDGKNDELLWSGGIALTGIAGQCIAMNCDVSNKGECFSFGKTLLDAWHREAGGQVGNLSNEQMIRATRAACRHFLDATDDWD